MIGLRMFQLLSEAIEMPSVATGQFDSLIIIQWR
jgi:hypothetical protein